MQIIKQSHRPVVKHLLVAVVACTLARYFQDSLPPIWVTAPLFAVQLELICLLFDIGIDQDARYRDYPYYY